MTGLTMQELVSKAAEWGLAPLLIPGKRVIWVFECPKCERKTMVKFFKDADKRHKIHACRSCGHRHMSPGWVKRWGTFLTGTE